MRPLASPAGMEHLFRVFLPVGYGENTLKRYPVLYMHDGNNLFLKRGSVSQVRAMGLIPGRIGRPWRTRQSLRIQPKLGNLQIAFSDLASSNYL